MTYYDNLFRKSNTINARPFAASASTGNALSRYGVVRGGCLSFRPTGCVGQTIPPAPTPPPLCPTPPAPGFLFPADGQIITEERPVFSGTALANVPVRLCINGVCAETTSDAQGLWNIPSPASLSVGTHVASATQRNFCGETSPESTVSFALESAFPSPPDVLTPAEGESVPGPNPYFSGTAQPGNTVTVCIGGVCQSAVADANGNWSLAWNQPIIGQVSAQITQTDAEGDVSAPVIREFVSLSDRNLLQISDLQMGSVFRSVDATFTPTEMDGDWRLYYVLHEPNVPDLPVEDVIGPADDDTFTGGWYVRGVENVPGNQMGLTLTIPLRGRNTPYTTTNEIGVMDGFPYVVQMIAVSSTGERSNEAFYRIYATGMPFDGGKGTVGDPFLLRELSLSELSNYPDLLAESPLNIAGVNETARQLDNLEGMRNKYEGNPQHGLPDTLELHYRMISGFNLAGYQNAYNGDGWRPIGNYDLTFDNPSQANHIFTGTMTADPSMPVTNLYLTPVGGPYRHVEYIGLFGYTIDATITGLYVRNAYIRTQPYAPTIFLSFQLLGAICGFAENGRFINVGAENVQFNNNFTAAQNWNIRSGAIVGTLYGGEINGAECTNVTVIGRPGTTSYYGAVVGEYEDYSYGANMRNVSVNDFTVTGVDWDVASIGGAIGIVRGGLPTAIANVLVQNVNVSGSFGYGGGLAGILQDFGGKTIENVVVRDVNIESTYFDASVGGLIGYDYLRENLRISDVSIRNANLRSRITAGGLIGLMETYEDDSAEFYDISVRANVDSQDGRSGGLIGALQMESLAHVYIHDVDILEGTYVDGSSICGGMIGAHESSVAPVDPLFIDDCSCAAYIETASSDAGGFIAYGLSVVLRNCLFTGYVSAPFHVGGMIAFANGCSLSQCSTTGSIEYSYLGGGLVGACDHSVTMAASSASPFPFTPNAIEKSSMRGDFVGTPSYGCGGLAGRLSGIIVDQCFSTADLPSPSGADTSAFVGLANYYADASSVIRNCYATGSVTGAPQNAGGLASSSGYRIVNSFFTGSVYSAARCGGIVGNPSAESVAESCLVMSPVVSTQSADPAYAGRIGSANGAYVSNYALDTTVLIKGGSPATPVENPNGPDGGTFTASATALMMGTLGWDTTNVWNTATIATIGRPTLINNPE